MWQKQNYSSKYIVSLIILVSFHTGVVYNWNEFVPIVFVSVKSHISEKKTTLNHY